MGGVKCGRSEVREDGHAIAHKHLQHWRGAGLAGLAPHHLQRGKSRAEQCLLASGRWLTVSRL